MLHKIGLISTKEKEKSNNNFDLKAISSSLTQINSEKKKVVENINQITSTNTVLLNETTSKSLELSVSLSASQLYLRETMQFIDNPNVSNSWEI